MKITLALRIAFAAAIVAIPRLAPAASDGCTLLTANQVSKVVGVPVSTGTHIGLPQDCAWYQTTAEKAKRLSVFIATPNAFDLGKLAGPGKVITSASGTGDAAYFVTTGQGSRTDTTLSVMKGASVVIIMVWGEPNVAKRKAQEKTLALQILPHL